MVLERTNGTAVRIGDRGRTLSSLHPQGFVRINGRRRDARSEREIIESETEIVVIGGDLQGLIVRPAESVHSVVSLPGYGQSVYSSFGEVLAYQEQIEEIQREDWKASFPQWRAARSAYGVRMGFLLGALFAAAGLWFSWGNVSQAGEHSWKIVLAVAGFGSLWGVGVFRLIDALQQRLLQGTLPRLEARAYDRLTLLSTGLSLLGTTGSAALTIPHWGLAAGLGIAIAATCVLGVIFPILLLANASSDDSPA
jgi:hypothetical protein